MTLKKNNLYLHCFYNKMFGWYINLHTLSKNFATFTAFVVPGARDFFCLQSCKVREFKKYQEDNKISLAEILSLFASAKFGDGLLLLIHWQVS